MNKVDNKNVVKVHDIYNSINNYYVIIDYCSKGDLYQYILQKGGHLSEAEAVYFLQQIMNGFKGLHEHNIMHRDLKLANIFLNENATNKN